MNLRDDTPLEECPSICQNRLANWEIPHHGLPLQRRRSTPSKRWLVITAGLRSKREIRDLSVEKYDSTDVFGSNHISAFFKPGEFFCQI